MMSEEEVEAVARAMHDPARDPVAEANGYRDTMPEDDAEVLGLARGEIAWLREAVRRLTQDAWRPIESAPKDGTEILVCVTHNLPDDEWETIIWTDCFHDEGWFRWSDRIDIPFPPKYWQPLPSPPSPDSHSSTMRGD